jgi:hypothetical protein
MHACVTLKALVSNVEKHIEEILGKVLMKVSPEKKKAFELSKRSSIRSPSFPTPSVMRHPKFNRLDVNELPNSFIPLPGLPM